MRMCQPHWDKLREAVEARGLGHLLAQDGEELGRRILLQNEEGFSEASFEPLFFAHMAIIQNSLDAGGLEMMGSIGEGCPLCWLTAKHAEQCIAPGCDDGDYGDWVQNAADDALKAWNDISGEPKH